MKLQEVDGEQNPGFTNNVENEDPPPPYDIGLMEYNNPESHQNLLDDQDTANRAIISSCPFLTEEEAKEALAQHVSEHCCYGKRPIKHLKFTSLVSAVSYRYILDTFTETRSTMQASVPYCGEQIIRNGPSPGPWQIEVPKPILFVDMTSHFEVPNTASVKPCHKCRASGYVMCTSCFGRGSETCSLCHGSGHRSDADGECKTCFSCHGRGRKRCFRCSSTGRVACKQCDTYGKLKCYVQLTVLHKTFQDDFIKDTLSDNIPDETIRKCRSKVTFTEENLRLRPINHHSDQTVNKASYDLIMLHDSKYSRAKILTQRHSVNEIPITHCKYEWKKNSSEFSVYGLENKVFAPDYPRKCFCNFL